MSTVIKTLHDFIDTAERNRKYPAGTASGRRAALRLFESELNDEERESLDTFKLHIDQIYNNVFTKNPSKMTAESLLTYRNRLNALISDYEKYGTNPIKMANWNRPVRKLNPKTKEAPKREEKQVKLAQEQEVYKDIDMSRFELPLRPGVKAIILVPSDISKSEVEKLRGYINFLDSIAGNKESVNNNEET